jgi:hypothetical protein
MSISENVGLEPLLSRAAQIRPDIENLLVIGRKILRMLGNVQINLRHEHRELGRV